MNLERLRVLMREEKAAVQYHGCPFDVADAMAAVRRWIGEMDKARFEEALERTLTKHRRALQGLAHSDSGVRVEGCDCTYCAGGLIIESQTQASQESQSRVPDVQAVEDERLR